MSVLLQKLMRIHGKPDCGDPDFLLNELNRMLRKFEDPVQERAFEMILADGKKYFPATGAIISACKEARKELYEDRIPETYKADDDWSEVSKSKANKLIQSKLGRKAADEGWIGCLWDFCRKSHRLPTPHEQIKIIDEAKGVDREIERCFETAVDNTGFGKIAHTFKDGILTRRKQLAEIAYGGKA